MLSERDKAGLINSAVAIVEIVAIVETVNGCFTRFTAPFDPDSYYKNALLYVCGIL